MWHKLLRGSEPQDGCGSVVLFISFVQEGGHEAVHGCVAAPRRRLVNSGLETEACGTSTCHSLMDDLLLVLSVGARLHQHLPLQERRERHRHVLFEDLEHFL